MSKISQILRRIIEKEKLSIRGVAKAIDVDHASLSRSLKENGNPESKTVEKILDYLGYELKISKRKEVKPGKSKPSRSRQKSKKEVV